MRNIRLNSSEGLPPEKLIWPSYPLIKMPRDIRLAVNTNYQNTSKRLKHDRMINSAISKISDFLSFKKKLLYKCLSTLFSKTIGKFSKLL